MGNPLINELLVGSGSRTASAWTSRGTTRSSPSFFLDPLIARVVNAPSAARWRSRRRRALDLLPLVTYAPPIAAAGTPAGPVADLLRLNTGVPPTPSAAASRLGLLGGDAAGFPNGRRLVDDVTDITLRRGRRRRAGGAVPGLHAGVNDRLGDGVNVNDAPIARRSPTSARPGRPQPAARRSGRAGRGPGGVIVNEQGGAASHPPERLSLRRSRAARAARCSSPRLGLFSYRRRSTCRSALSQLPPV